MLIHPAIFDNEQFNCLENLEQLVLIKIISRLNNKSGMFFCKQETLLRFTGVSKKWLRKMLFELNKKKWLLWKSGAGRGVVTQLKIGKELLTFYEKTGNHFKLRKNGNVDR